MTTVAIHQPQYLPWLAYLDKADQADIFVYLDIVQYQRGGLQNRNQVRRAGQPLWLTVPVQARSGDRIIDVKVADQRWQKKHLSSLQQSYARAPFAERRQGLEAILSAEWEHLVDVTIASTEWLFDEFRVAAQRVRASELEVAGARDDLVVSIVKAVGGDRYLSGRGARGYQDPDKFERAGVELLYQTYEPAAYRQCPPEPFTPGLSAVDALLNEGPRARPVMLAGRRPSATSEQVEDPVSV